ncbi:MAG: outer membrane protein assembly factor BamD, partial [Alphaproteobacteria bacterium]|nr:outer membrane protein assembly factor BamD [Alphaproteobacteria bacterium]
MKRLTSYFPKVFGCVAAVMLLAAPLALSGCAGDDEDPAYVERPVEDIYNEAMNHMSAGRYSSAAKSFDEVERQHPYSKWATKAQIMAGYAYYMEGKYDDAIVALNRFIDLHPGHKDTAYAWYLKGLSYYEQISDVSRDQRMTEGALDAFDNLVRRFPDSDYARDARLKVDLAHDHLAGKDMNVGRYYLRAGHYLAAIGRFRRVVDKWGTSTHVPEALHRLTEAYLALGVVEEARYTAAVLRHNFPDSEWYQDSWALLEFQDVLTAEERGLTETVEEQGQPQAAAEQDLTQTAGVPSETAEETN